MKQFRLIGMALLAIVMCVNFTSCDDDDDELNNDNGIITNQKKLMKIEETNGETITFSYDKQSRLTSVKDSYLGVENEIINFNWGNNTIITVSQYGEECRYTLSDNLVREEWCDDEISMRFTYDSSNQLKRIDDISRDEVWSSTYTWNNGKIIRYTYGTTDDDEPAVYEYTYNGRTCKGWFPNMADESWDAVNNEYIFYAHPELVGMRNNQLPEQIKEDNGRVIRKFAYKFDKDGYVESCTEEYTEYTESKLDTYKTVYTFTWE